MTGFVSLNEIKSLGERGRRSNEKKNEEYDLSFGDSPSDDNDPRLIDASPPRAQKTVDFSR